MIRFLPTGICTSVLLLVLCPALEAAPAHGDLGVQPDGFEDYLPILIGGVVVLGVVAVGLALRGGKGPVDTLPPAEAGASNPQQVEQQPPELVPAPNSVLRVIKPLSLVAAVAVLVVIVSGLWSDFFKVFDEVKEVSNSAHPIYYQQMPVVNLPPFQPIPPPTINIQPQPIIPPQPPKFPVVTPPRLPPPVLPRR
jgi:hypothetical protein